MLKRKYTFAVIWSLVLAAFTFYVLLDTFIIARGKKISDDNYYDSLFAQEDDVKLSDIMKDKGRERTVEKNGINTDAGIFDESRKQNDTEATTIGSYTDDNISVTITKHRDYNTDIYVAEVHISSMKYLKCAFAKDTYGRNVTAKTSDTAKVKNAIFAINGDYYGARSEGFVIRNGILYRDTPSYGRKALVIKTDGMFETVTENGTSAKGLLDSGAAHAFSFGPSLVENGEIALLPKDEYGRSAASNPRTAVGMIEPLHYVFVVADGRTPSSHGLSVRQLANFMTNLGVVNGYNLDGGGSSAMYFDGKIINNPTTNGRSISERSVSDIVYIGN